MPADSNPTIDDFDVDFVCDHMTLHEKCVLLAGPDGWHTAGVPRLGVPAVMMCDGPNGLRKQSKGADMLGFTKSEPATCFPTESALACSFDPDLIESVGRALGEEARDAGVSMLLGPGINMKRSPLCGRNFEYYAEDPYLSGTLAAAHIRGAQSVGVGSSLKHFAGNSQEKARMTSDSVISSRALHEVYLRAFSIAVKQQPMSVMTAYNRLNGVYCSQNSRLITRTLREAWDYDGLVVTDWEALSSLNASLPAGLDLVMPGPREDYIDEVESCVKSHEISTRQLDRTVRRILTFTKQCVEARRIPCTCDIDEHLDLAEKAAERSAVLLKNEDGLLPIADDTNVAVIGAFAKHPRFQGTGSSRVNAVEVDSFLDEFRKIHGASVSYAEGYDAETGVATREQLRSAADLASRSDVAIVYAGLPQVFESEGFDRRQMRIPEDQVHLIMEVCAKNPRTVVVLVGGAPMETPWRRCPQSILLTYLSGCQGGRAAARLITGKANPSGKLAETWPLRLEDTPTAGRFPDPSREILYTEDIYIGYRYYDAVGAQVAYPFGFGLSYTRFAYTGLHVNEEDAKGLDDVQVRLSFTISNTGSFDGREIAQVYVAPMSQTVYHAPQTLEGYRSVPIPAGQSRDVSIDLPRKAFAHWSTSEDGWTVEDGDFEIRVGASSRDVRLSQTVHVRGEAPRFDGAPARYHHPFAGCFSDASVDGTNKDAWGNDTTLAHARKRTDIFAFGGEPIESDGSNSGESERMIEQARDDALTDFKRIYGRDLPQTTGYRPYTLDSTLRDTGNSRIGRMFYPLVVRGLENVIKDERVRERYVNMLDDMPIRSVHMQGFSMNSANVMVHVLNHRYAKAASLWWSRHVSGRKQGRARRSR